MALPPSLRPLADAATQLAHGNDRRVHDVAGSTALLFGRYRITRRATSVGS